MLRRRARASGCQGPPGFSRLGVRESTERGMLGTKEPFARWNRRARVFRACSRCCFASAFQGGWGLCQRGEGPHRWFVRRVALGASNPDDASSGRNSDASGYPRSAFVNPFAVSRRIGEISRARNSARASSSNANSVTTRYLPPLHTSSVPITSADILLFTISNAISIICKKTGSEVINL